MIQVIPYSSQLRFYIYDKNVNYESVLPTTDLNRPNIEYQKGIHAVNYYPDFALGALLSMTLVSELIGMTYIVDENNNINYATPVKITSSEWNGTPVYLFEFNLNSEGIFRVEIQAGGYTLVSDYFYVKNWAETKDLIKINYSDSNNSNGIYYYDNNQIKWTPSVYYTGYIIPDTPDLEISSFVSEPNITINTRVTPKLKEKMIICNLHSAYLSNLTYQLSCNNLKINNVNYTFESLEVSTKDNSTLIDVTVILSRNDNNGYQQF